MFWKPLLYINNALSACSIRIESIMLKPPNKSGKFPCQTLRLLSGFGRISLGYQSQLILAMPLLLRPLQVGIGTKPCYLLVDNSAQDCQEKKPTLLWMASHSGISDDISTRSTVIGTQGVPIFAKITIIPKPEISVFLGVIPLPIASMQGIFTNIWLL